MIREVHDAKLMDFNNKNSAQYIYYDYSPIPIITFQWKTQETSIEKFRKDFSNFSKANYKINFMVNQGAIQKGSMNSRLP